MRRATDTQPRAGPRSFAFCAASGAALVVATALLGATAYTLLGAAADLRAVPRPTPGPALSIDDILRLSGADAVPAVQWGANATAAVYYRADALWQQDVSLPLSLAPPHVLCAATAGDNPCLNGTASLSRFLLSPSGRTALLPVAWRGVYRHSGRADALLPLALDGGCHCGPALQQAAGPLRLAAWSPNGMQAAVVDDAGTLWLVSESTGAAWAWTRVAAGALNGAPSWVYEEEVLGSARALWWSPDGAALAYLRTNTSAVPDAHLLFYEGLPDARLYAQPVAYAYPMPGGAPPAVSLHVYDVARGSTLDVAVPEPMAYITQVLWANATELVVRTLTRAQNASALTAFTPTVPMVHAARVLARTTARTAWLPEPVPGTPLFLPDGSFVDGGESDSDSGHRIGLVHRTPDGALLAQLPLPAGCDVTAVAGASPAGVVYCVLACPSPVVRTVYAAAWPAWTVAPLTAGDAWDTATVVAQRLVLHTRLGPGAPERFVRPLGGDSDSWKEDSGSRVAPDAYAAFIAELDGVRGALPGTFATTVATETGLDLHATLVLPPGVSPADLHAAPARPLLLNVYGGPDSQAATRTFALGFNAYVASALGVVVTIVDGRGTGARGGAFSRTVAGRLGVLEAEDQAAAARALSRLPGVDAARVGLWGWSYGGFATLMTLGGPGRGVFRTGMAVAPVTDWRLYDLVYTERYMGRPQDNAAGYAAASVLARVADMDVPALVAAGTGDDNVHFAHTAALQRRLIELGKHNVDVRVYPDDAHAIRRPGSRAHLYASLATHLRRHLLE